MILATPHPFAEARSKLGQRSPIALALSSSEWADVPVALRERAFFSAHVENARFLERTQGLLDDFLSGAREEVTRQDGTKVSALKVGSRAQFVDLVRRHAIEEGIPVPEEWRGTIRDITNSNRLALIFDIQTQSAQEFGSWKQGMNPDVLNEFPANRFIREVDVAQPRALHVQNTGVVRLKTDLPFWLTMNSRDLGGFGVPWGPWGFGSGMGVEDVDRTEAEALGLVKPGQRLAPVEKDFNDHLKASVTNLSPEIQEFLRQKLGDSVKFQDGAVWWKGDRASKRDAGVAPVPRKKAAPIDPNAFPERLDTLVPVRRLGGSTGAELVRDPLTGQLFVRKEGNSPDHVREEFAADQVYRALGVNVPEARLYDDGKRPVKLARFIEGRTLGSLPPSELEAAILKLRDQFAADAWMGNWDVAGTGLDNVLVDEAGTPWRIDNGGSLRFRAQGARKTAEEWNDWPTDLWTMRDAAKFPVPGKVFGGMPIFDVSKGIRGLDGRISAAIQAAPAELQPVLGFRWEQMRQIAAKALDYQSTQFTASYSDEVTRWMMELRKSGVFDRLSSELRQGKAGDYVLNDENGVPFDHLRTQKGQKHADPSENFFLVVSEAAKTINGHHFKGDTAYNQGKLSNAAALAPELKKLSISGNPQQKAMAAHYLGVLEGIESAKGNPGTKVPFVTKFELKSTASKAQRSVISEFADWMSKNGGDWSIVSQWAGDQAGSSKSNGSQALKRLLLDNLVGASESDFWDPPAAKNLAAMRKAHGDRYDRSMLMFQAFVQEVLGRLQFPGNDRNARSVRILRTETNAGAVPIPVGKVGTYKRGVNESGSLFYPVFTGARTITVVPHTRITSLYFFERTPGAGGDFLLGDMENEATYIGWGLRVLNLGVLPKERVPTKIGSTRKEWEL